MVQLNTYAGIVRKLGLCSLIGIFIFSIIFYSLKLYNNNNKEELKNKNSETEENKKE